MACVRGAIRGAYTHTEIEREKRDPHAGEAKPSNHDALIHERSLTLVSSTMAPRSGMLSTQVYRSEMSYLICLTEGFSSLSLFSKVLHRSAKEAQRAAQQPPRARERSTAVSSTTCGARAAAGAAARPAQANNPQRDASRETRVPSYTPSRCSARAGASPQPG